MGRMYGKGYGVAAWSGLFIERVFRLLACPTRELLLPGASLLLRRWRLLCAVLRDQKGIGQVKAVTGSKILRILKKNGRCCVFGVMRQDWLLLCLRICTS